MSRSRLSRWAFAVALVGFGGALLDWALRRSEDAFYKNLSTKR